MGTTLSDLCLRNEYTEKPSQDCASSEAQASTVHQTPVSSLKRLMVKSKTLPVIHEEESERDSLTSSQVAKKPQGIKVRSRAMIIRNRLKEGYRRGRTSAS